MSQEAPDQRPRLFSDRMAKRPALWWLRGAFALLSVALIVWLVDVSELWQRTRSISISTVGFALILNGCRQLLLARRWQLMNSAETSHPFGDYLLFILASRPATVLLPGGLGFDMARMVLIGRDQLTDSGEHRISVLSDRILGLASVIVLGLLSVAIAPVFASRLTYALMIGGLLFAFAAALMLSISSPVQSALRSRLSTMGRWGTALADALALWSRVVDFFRANPRRVLVAFVICLLIHLSWFAIVWTLAENLQLHLSFFVVGTVTALSWVVVAVPVSWMGVGTSELSFLFLLSLQGVARESAVALSLQQSAIHLITALLCVPMLLWVVTRRGSTSAD